MSTIIERITTLRTNDAEISIKKLRAHLVVEDYSNKDISEALKELEISAERKSFKGDFNAWLIEAPRTKEEATTYIEDNGSDNDRRQKSARLLIWALAQDIRASLATPTEEAEETEAA